MTVAGGTIQLRGIRDYKTDFAFIYSQVLAAKRCVLRGSTKKQRKNCFRILVIGRHLSLRKR